MIDPQETGRFVGDLLRPKSVDGTFHGRTNLVCWFMRGMGDTTTTKQILAFWREVRGDLRRYEDGSTPCEQLQSLLTTSYGGVSLCLTGKVSAYCMPNYGKFSPLVRLTRGLYTLSHDGYRRAELGAKQIEAAKLARLSRD